MTRFTLGLALVCLYWLTGCGARAVDLDQATPDASAPPDFEAKVVLNEELNGVWIDGPRLYWLASSGDPWAFQSCLTTDCEHTKLTYMRTVQQVAATVADGHVYWTAGTSFFSCAAEGCQGQPVMMAQDPAAGGKAIFAHRGYVYWSSDFDIYRCSTQGCETPEIVASNRAADQLVFDDQRAYWVGALGILSVPSDGSEPPKLLTPQLRNGDWIKSLAVGGEYLYWSAGKQVFRCALASCNASAPTPLVTADAPITDLKVDGSAMYWLEADAIHSCPLTGCEQSIALTPPKVARLHSLGNASRFAIDANYVYWLEVGDDTRGLPPLPEGKSIRRTAK
jgi:hypothetical protein